MDCSEPPWIKWDQNNILGNGALRFFVNYTLMGQATEDFSLLTGKAKHLMIVPEPFRFTTNLVFEVDVEADMGNNQYIRGKCNGFSK